MGEKFIEHSYKYFGKTCAFGIKTFLDTYLFHGKFVIGLGLNCYPAHSGQFKNNTYDFFRS